MFWYNTKQPAWSKHNQNNFQSRSDGSWRLKEENGDDDDDAGEDGEADIETEHQQLSQCTHNAGYLIALATSCPIVNSSPAVAAWAGPHRLLHSTSLQLVTIITQRLQAQEITM